MQSPQQRLFMPFPLKYRRKATQIIYDAKCLLFYDLLILCHIPHIVWNVKSLVNTKGIQKRKGWGGYERSQKRNGRKVFKIKDKGSNVEKIM